MAFDGIVIANIKKELTDHFLDGRITKVAQPEKDELILTIRGTEGQKRLLISANASLPLICLTEEKKQNPMTAPNFCMLLRKHIQGGVIRGIEQPGFERILVFFIEHRDEMGDLRTKKLIVEMMGKHSNIIFCDESDRILDSIRHVSAQISSVREVLPGRTWFIPGQEGKISPEEVRDPQTIRMRLIDRPMSACKALYGSFTGISPVMANEICYRAGVDGDLPCASLSEKDLDGIADVFLQMFADVRAGNFSPDLVSSDRGPVEYAAFHLYMYDDQAHRQYESISALLNDFYSQKAAVTRIRQKSAELRHTVSVLLERTRKKYDLQMKQYRDTEKKDRYRKYGLMIQTYAWQLEKGMASFEEVDYETGERLRVPLDRELAPMENAQKYFDRYAKLKRTAEALSGQTKDSHDSLMHLESIASFLETAETESDLLLIREELAESGYIRKNAGGRKRKEGKKENRPWHFRLTDGYDAYVGKNNLQNDQLTFRVAQGNDWWFHAKGMPGSHVIVKCPGGEMPDRAFEEAGRLAGYFSKGRGNDRVEIDYIQKKHVKKPNKSRPGFVVYYTNYSLSIAPKIDGIQRVEED